MIPALPGVPEPIARKTEVMVAPATGKTEVMAAPVEEIVSVMQEAAPAGRQMLADTAVAELRALTEALITERANAIEELARFHEIRERRMEPPEQRSRTGCAAGPSW
jgi:hypothetical protein